MAVTASNATFDVPELRTGLKCSHVSSATGFLTKGASVDADHFLRTQAAPLKMVHPRPNAQLTFASIWTKWVTNAPYKAYPSAVGGASPYVWSLIGAPSGMTIASPTLTDNSTYALCAAHGRITWASPSAGTHTFLVRCTDQNGIAVSESVSLNIADSNAIWVDPVSGTDSTGVAGTKAAPFKKIDNWYGGAAGMGAGDRADTTYQSKVVIIRTGTLTVPVDEAGTVLGLGANKPTTWVAYDTESPVLDCSSSAIALNGNGGTANRLEFIGLTTRYEDVTDNNTFQMLINPDHDEGTAGSAATIAAAGHVIICDHIIDSYKNQGVLGNDNCGGIRMSDPDGATGLAKKMRRIQMRNIQITNLGGGASSPTTGTQVAAILPMATRDSEYNNIALVSQTGICSVIVKFKHHHENIDIRFLDIRPTYTGTSAISVQGGGGITQTDGPRVEYCLLYLDPTSLGINEAVMRVSANNSAEGKLGAMWFRRNTFMGHRPQLTDYDPAATPNSVRRGANVLECPTTWEDHATWSGSITTTPSETADLYGTTGITDANGLLEGANRTSWLGIKGWEIA